MNKEILHQIGLTKSEVKVYIALLELGSSTTGPVMHKAKVSSSKIYGILLRLMEKGLVSFIIKNKTKFYQPTPPKALEEYMKKREEEFRQQQQELHKLIPQLASMQRLSSQKEEARLYLGWKGVMNAFDFALQLLKENDDYIGFAQVEPEEASPEAKHFFRRYHRRRQEKRLHVRLIAEKSQKSTFQKAPYSRFRNFTVRYVDNLTPGLVIFGDNILLSTLGKNPVAVVISSREISHAYRTYFESMWKKAQKG